MTEHVRSGGDYNDEREVSIAADVLAAVVVSANGRLDSVELVRVGRRVILARAVHRPSQQEVLLTVSNPEFGAGRDQVARIARLMVSARSVAIGSVLDSFFYAYGDSRGTCIVSTWHAESQTLESALTNNRMPVNIIEALLSTTRQISAVHDAGYAHGDISMSNVLVSSVSGVHLVDLEYVTAERFLDDEGVFLTQVYSHPGRLAALQSNSYDLATAQRWDRYALGQIFLQVLADADPYHYPELDLCTQRALRLIGCLLLDGVNDPSETALGLPEDFFVAEHYKTLQQAIDALERVLGTPSVEVRVPELSRVPVEIVQVGTSDPAPFTGRVRALVSTPAMRQLNSCLQLGLICLIWPTASHTRLEHALGTFAMMRDAIIALHADPQSPLFRVLVTPGHMRTLLAAALLHDVGHYPLAHDLEEAYPAPFRHENRSIEFVTSEPIADILRRSETDTDGGWNIEPADVASVIAGELRPGSTLTSWMCGMLHSILSGSLDVDKLDYLIRDSNALGVAAGAGIDVRRVVSSLTIAVIVRSGGGADLRVAVRAKGIRPAELVGRVRSHMFGVAYWHRSYRAIKAMMHWMVWDAIDADTEHESEVKKHGKALAAELMRSSGSAALSKELGFVVPAPDAATEFEIPQREAAILATISAFGRMRNPNAVDRTPEILLRLLSQHRWYKAVLTIDHYQNLQVTSAEDGKRAKRVWETLQKLIDPARKISHETMIARRMQLSKLLQRRIFESLEDAHPLTRILNPERTHDEMLRVGATTQLFFVDFIEKSKSRDKPLYFLATERPGSRLTNTADLIPVRESYDQKQLSSEFLVSNGAIRIFCHPDFARFVTASITPERLEDILLDVSSTLLSR